MKRTKSKQFNSLLKYLPEIFTCLSQSCLNELCEIRIRAEKPVAVVFQNKTGFLTEKGRLTYFIAENLLTFSKEDVEKIFIRMCNYSVHSLTENISDGFVTLDGGCRVGVYGTAVTRSGGIVSVRNIEGLNIRIPGEYPGCSLPIYNSLFQGETTNTVLCGPPMSGKTTVLRDLCRTLSDERQKKIAVIDERFEMSGFNLGFNTDILKGYPKSKGIEIAVRTLSPDIVICDEIGNLDEADRLCEVFNSGVSFIVTMHCRNTEELFNRPQFQRLQLCNAIGACVFLEKDNFNIKKIIRFGSDKHENNLPYCSESCLYSGGELHIAAARQKGSYT